MTFFLSDHGQYEEYDVAGGVQSVQVLLFKEYRNRRIMLLELSDPSYTIQQVSGKTTDRLRDDHVDFP